MVFFIATTHSNAKIATKTKRTLRMYSPCVALRRHEPMRPGVSDRLYDIGGDIRIAWLRV